MKNSWVKKWASGNSSLFLGNRKRSCVTSSNNPLSEIRWYLPKACTLKAKPMAARAKEVMDQISMVGWVSGGHSAGYVPVFAIGAGSQLFGEKIDNTEIPENG